MRRESADLKRPRRKAFCIICRVEMFVSHLQTHRSQTHGRMRATHCYMGHEYTEENTVHYGNGYRTCRTCRQRRYLLQKKGAVKLWR